SRPRRKPKPGSRIANSRPRSGIAGSVYRTRIDSTDRTPFALAPPAAARNGSSSGPAKTSDDCRLLIEPPSVARSLLVAKRIAIAVAGFQADFDFVDRVETQDQIKCRQSQNQNESWPGEASPETLAVIFVGIILRHCSGSLFPAKPALVEAWPRFGSSLPVHSWSGSLVDGLAGAP